MADSTFTISTTVATFTAHINGSSQESPEPERITISALFANATEWNDAVSLITSKYHVHTPLGGNAVIDVARGLGVGTLVISGLGTTSALLVDVRATAYGPGARRQAVLTFIRTAAWS